MSLKASDVAVINGSKDNQNRTSSCTRPSYSDKQEDGWSVSRYTRHVGIQRGQKERRIRIARLWEVGETEKKSADGIQSQDAREDQDSSQDRRQIPSRQGGEGRGSRNKEVVAASCMLTELT